MIRLSRRLRYLTQLNVLVLVFRRIFNRPVIIHERMSLLNGVIRVIDCGRERKLQFSDQCQTFWKKDGTVGEVRREYWGSIHKTPFGLPRTPHVLMCGLGGGATLHMVYQDLKPARTTVVEIDPEIVSVSRAFFGVDAIPNLQIIQGDARDVVSVLASSGRRFDLVIEDAVLPLMGSLELSMPYIQTLFRVLSPGGSIAFNVPVYAESMQQIRRFVSHLASDGCEVRTSLIRGRWSNCIVFCRPMG